MEARNCSQPSVETHGGARARVQTVWCAPPEVVAHVADQAPHTPLCARHARSTDPPQCLSESMKRREKRRTWRRVLSGLEDSRAKVKWASPVGLCTTERLGTVHTIGGWGTWRGWRRKGGETADFLMSVTTVHPTPLARKLREGSDIITREQDILMDSKLKFLQGAVPHTRRQWGL